MVKILIGADTLFQANFELERCLKELLKRDILATHCFFSKKAIQTSRCYIQFTTISRLNRHDGLNFDGLRFDACFGIPIKNQILLNKSNKPTDYEGTYIDYISEIEHNEK